MHTSTLKKIGKRVLQIGLPVVILVLFLQQVKNNWSQLTAHTFQWNPWLLALAFLGFMLQELSYGLIWQNILARLGARLGLRMCLRIYLASEFVRYIPGNVWHVLTRILWVSKYGVSRPVAFASMTIELVTKIAAGVLVFSASLLFWRDFGAIGSVLHGPLVDILGIASIFALLVILHPRVLNGLLNQALRLLKREPVRLGLLPICIGIYALAWDIGFVSFITPSGLGFREAAIVGLFALALPLPAGLATIMALLSRFVSTIAEVICVSIAYVSGGNQVRTLQQGTQTHLPGETNKEIRDSGTIPAEVSASVPVEGGTMGE